MSRTVEQFLSDVEGVKNYLQDSFTTDILTESVMNMTGKIIKRVQVTGKLFDGTMRRYSTLPTLVGASSFKNKSTFKNKVLPLVKKSTKKTKKGKLEGDKYLRDSTGLLNKFYSWFTIESGGKMVHLVLLPGGYAEIRRLDGDQVAHKDYFRTGEMWRKTGVIESKTTKDKVFIGGQTAQAQKLLDVNSWRDKTNILKPTQEEIDEQAIYIRKELIKYINAKLGANV